MSSGFTITVTNNVGYDVDIFNVFSPVSNPTPGTPVALTYTKLATVPNGAVAQQVQGVPGGSSLQAMITGNIETLNGNYYQQFPAAVMGVSLFAMTLDFTLTSEMLQNMVDSFQFIKYMQANPSSAQAKGFRTALAQKTPEDAINAFFPTTASFQQCTYSTWNTVFTWQTQFTSAWQGGQSTPVAMPGDGTMQEQNIGTGNLSVSLNPVWLNVVQTSHKTGDVYNVIGAAFAGTINNVNVAGNINQLVVPSIPSTSPTFGSVMSSICHYSDKLGSLIGILTGVATVLIMFKDSKAAEKQRILDAQKEAKTESEAKDKEAKIKAESDAKFQSEFIQASPTVEFRASQAVDGYKEVAVADNVQKNMKTVLGEGEKLQQELTDDPSNPAIEKTDADLGGAVEDLMKADNPGTSLADDQAILKNVDKTVADTSEDLKTEVQDANNTASKSEQTAEKGVEKVAEDVKNQAEETKEVKKMEEAEAEAKVSDPVDGNDFRNEKREGGGEGEGKGEGRSKPVSSQIRFISYMLFEYIYYASQTQLELPRRESTFRIKQSSCSHIYHCVLT
ncbi:hypothetical protein FGSG_10628 [Fusarium graminearum PH-1]|uniref:hypothetical protein n=1 Tax=Gibberella zeae (strain ATCC MYA-4620 / CBS 123657 / FGSC 9075 / NRRL 31084 / PH-1) TaxID=229533 RepID=UPI00021F1DDB|nr:hypothetical protein FGSG_10628 [Fusarium graminearum PH-1]ESU17371.1 hypothetical protein FGSG_10628 [Fusarium graminearum PH-1]|eukprot:XP_011319633.1 hypothetical protein FGSG_10628 [Fusarium graminearum PH-1]